MTVAILITPWFVHEIFQHTHFQIITRLAIVHTLKVLILRMQRSFAHLVKSKGNCDYSMTLRYAHLSAEHTRAAIKTLGTSLAAVTHEKEEKIA